MTRLLLHAEYRASSICTWRQQKINESPNNHSSEFADIRISLNIKKEWIVALPVVVGVEAAVGDGADRVLPSNVHPVACLRMVYS